MEEITLTRLPHPEAFNPALIHWHGRILLMYRVGWDDAELFLGELDRDFQPVSEFRKVIVPKITASEDPRFFVHRNQLHFAFVGLFSEDTYRIGIGQVNDDLTVRDCRMLEGPDPHQNEKNWIFFSRTGQLYFTYAMADGIHQVCRLTDDRCEPLYRTNYQNPWKWGLARGGTQLIPHEGLWYGFFHGTDYQCEGLAKRYYMGAYAVSPEPPFSIVKMSRIPLYTPPEARLHPAARNEPERLVANVFPTGLMLKEDAWLVCSGYNNHAIKIFRISHAEMESNLISTVPTGRFIGESVLNSASCRSEQTARVHWYPLDRFWSEPLEFVKKHGGKDETVFAEKNYREHFAPASIISYEKITVKRLRKNLNWVILHKNQADSINLAILNELRRNYRAVFANDVFVVFTNKPLPEVISDFDPNHTQALWIKVENRQSATANRKPARLKRFLLSLLK